MARDDAHHGLDTFHRTQKAIHGRPALGIAAVDLDRCQVSLIEGRPEHLDEIGSLGAVGAHRRVRGAIIFEYHGQEYFQRQYLR